MPPSNRQSFLDLNRLPLVLSLAGHSMELIYWGLIDPKSWRNYLHVHSFYEVCYAFAGEGTFRIRDEEKEVRAGQVFTARPGEPHEILSSGHEGLGIYFWAFTLVRNEGQLQAFKETVFTSFASSLRTVAPGPESLDPLITMLIDEMSNRRSGYQEAVEGLATKLILDAVRVLVDHPLRELPLPPATQDPSSAVVAQIAAYLQDNFGWPVAIRDVAAQVHLSERHTSRLFRNATGSSVGEYLTTLRLERASKLLLTGGMSIKEVARAVGYADTRHFITRFRCHFGQPPAVYRSQHLIRKR